MTMKIAVLGISAAFSLALLAPVSSHGAGELELLWEKRHDSGNNDVAYGAATDGNGNIIVTGESESDYFTDFLTIKYDSQGNELWKVSYDGSTEYLTSPDAAYGIAVDSLDNVIVVGKSTVYSDRYVVKYSSSGSKIWDRIMNLGLTDNARGVAIDSDDNIVVTGHSIFQEDLKAGKSWDYITVKYDPNGNYLWGRTYNRGDDRAYGVTIGSNNSVVVVGVSEEDIRTIKYDSSGGELWNKVFDSGYRDQGNGVATDSAGNILVAGYSTTDTSTYPPESNAVVIKYDSNGNELWRRTHNRAGSTFDMARSVTTDKYDNVIMGGVSDRSLSIAIYDKNGNIISEYARSAGSGTEAFNAVAVDKNNDIIAAGCRYTAAAKCDYQIMKFKGYGSTSAVAPSVTILAPQEGAEVAGEVEISVKVED